MDLYLPTGTYDFRCTRCFFLSVLHVDAIFAYCVMCVFAFAFAFAIVFVCAASAMRDAAARLEQYKHVVRATLCDFLRFCYVAWVGVCLFFC